MDNGDSFKKVRSGEPLVIPANFYNAMVDVIGWVKQQQRAQSAGDANPYDMRTVLIRNDSGGDLPAQSVLGISGLVFNPATNANSLASFTSDPVLTGITPSLALHLGKFAVLAAPIAAGQIGPAFASGICAVKILFKEPGDEWADVADSDSSILKSGAAGACKILWRPAYVDPYNPVWALIRFGDVGPAEQRVWILSHGSQPPTGERRWVYAAMSFAGSKYSGGYGGPFFTDAANGMNVISPVYNYMEWGNPVRGLMGNGIDTRNLPGTYDLQPINNGRMVTIWRVQTIAVETGLPNGTEWWMNEVNDISGDCVAP